MSYVAESLDEVADVFAWHANVARENAKKAGTQLAAASYRGEETGWRQAADILRRTTMKEHAQ